MKHDVRWQNASPLWPLAMLDSGAPPLRLDRPAILRFDGDDFMQKLQSTLAGDAARVSEHSVRYETWRSDPAEAVGWLAEAAFLAEPPAKLYQPAHNRFYLAVGSLICRTYSLPDRLVDAGKGEAASLLVRRLAAKSGATFDPRNPATFVEQAWIGDRQKGSWLPIANADTTAPEGEERLPLFPTVFKERGRNRRVWAGLIPVGGRENYEAGTTAPASETAGDTLSDPRAAAFQAEVLDAIRALSQIDSGAGNDATARIQFMFALVSFGDFLQWELPAVWDAIAGGPAPTGAANDIFNILWTETIDSTRWAVLIHGAAADDFRAALFLSQTDPLAPIPTLANAFSAAEIRAAATSLLNRPSGGERGWLTLVDEAAGDHRLVELRTILESYFGSLPALPASFGNAALQEKLLEGLVALAGFIERELNNVWLKIADPAHAPSLSAQEQAVVNVLQTSLLRSTSWAALLVDAAKNRSRIEAGEFDWRLESIRQNFTRAEIESMAAAISSGGLMNLAGAAFAAAGALTPPDAGVATAETHYVARMIYERPACRGVEPPVISKPSGPFRLAAFFDPDAPVRPARIRLPVDTTFEGLSKFPKSVTMMMSDQLRKQVSRARDAGLQGLMDGSVGGDPAVSLGLICSFSIPIITICALILLMIIVQLLNIVFWWIPLFRICLPLNLKAKGN